jgi:MFS family permease
VLLRRERGAGLLASRFPVFGLRDFRLIFVASAVSATGNAFTTVALAFGVLEQTHSTTAIGIVVGARQLAQVAFLLVGGAWGDRLPRRTLIACAYGAAALTQAMTAALLLADVGTVWNLATVAAANGIALAFLMPAMSGILPDIVPTDLLQQANAGFSVVRNSANIAGAALAGVLVAATNAGWALAVDAVSFALGAALVLAMHATPRPPSAKEPLIAQLRDGWREFIRRTWVWTIVVQFTVFVMGFTAALNVYAPVIAKHSLGGANAYGLIMSFFGIGAIAGGLSMARYAPARPLVVATLATLVSVSMFALLAVPTPLWTILVAALAGGAGVEVFMVLWSSALQTHIPPERLSRVVAYDAFGSFAFAPLGSALAGPVADALGGIGPAMWLAFALMLAPTLLVLTVPDVWRLRRTEPATAA